MMARLKTSLGLALVAAVVGVGITHSAHAMPTRNEVYRSDRLNITVYKDSQDAEVFWYVPPVKLYEEGGKVVYYKKAKGDTLNYFFYIMPYMTEEIVQLLAGEIPGIQNRTQLKPVVAQQFGIQIKQFNTVAMGDPVSDYQYLNQPYLVKIALPAADADEFEFFLNNKPGVQANVLVRYEAEKMAKYVLIEVSCRDIYNALNIGGTGRYSFAKAEISQSVEEYTSNKYYNVKSKGDLQIPEIVNKSIEECFTPFKKADPTKRRDVNRYDYLSGMASKVPNGNADLEKQLGLLSSIEFGTGTADDEPMPFPRRPGTFPGRVDDEPRGPIRPSDESGKNNVSLEFTFKKEKTNSEKAFFYKHENFVDTTETKVLQAYLSVVSAGGTTGASVTPLAKKDFVVEATNAQDKIRSTGIKVGRDEQYTITAVFALAARSYFRDYEKRWYRWDSKWGNVDEELYYRVGDGPWNKVNGRVLIKTDGIYKGELEFYLDRKKVWEKIDSSYKKPKAMGLIPAIFTYSNTFPQFNVVVTGRKLQLDR